MNEPQFTANPPVKTIVAGTHSINHSATNTRDSC
jgi:hypothetical protein